MELTPEQSWAELKSDLRYEFDGDERKFEDYVADALPEIFEQLGVPPIDRLEHQSVVRGVDYWVRLDLLVRHVDRTLSVVEVKKCRSRLHVYRHEQAQAVGQLLEYGQLIEANSGVMPRLFLVDNKLTPRVVTLINRWHLPIVAIEIQGDRVFIPAAGGRDG